MGTASVSGWTSAVRSINHFPDYYRGSLALLNSMKHDQDHHVPGAMELFLICLGRTLGCIGVSLFSRKRRSFYSFFLINKNGCEEDSSSRLFNGDVRILYDTKSTRYLHASLFE